MWETRRFYSLYCKRIVTLSQVTRFEIVIRDHEEKLVFKTTVWIDDKHITSMEASIKALISGLAEAMILGIAHISIFCNCYTMFSYLCGSLVPKKKEIMLLVDDVRRVSTRFRSIHVVMMNGKDIELTYKLARESLSSQITRPLCGGDMLFQGWKTEAKKGACVLCFNDILPDLAFSVDQCGHQFCLNCVKRHTEVKLLGGSIHDCPRLGCKFMLSFDRCVNPKLSLIWKQRIKEDIVYHPHPGCYNSRGSYVSTVVAYLAPFTTSCIRILKMRTRS